MLFTARDLAANRFLIKLVIALFSNKGSNSASLFFRHAFSLITEDVIEATSQCLLAISDSAQSNGQAEELTKQQILEEFGRCLQEIIKCSSNRN